MYFVVYQICMLYFVRVMFVYIHVKCGIIFWIMFCMCIYVFLINDMVKLHNYSYLFTF